MSSRAFLEGCRNGFRNHPSRSITVECRTIRRARAYVGDSPLRKHVLSLSDHCVELYCPSSLSITAIPPPNKINMYDQVDASSSPGYTDSYSSDVALVPSTTAPCHACVNEPPSASPTTPYACGNDPPSASSTNPYQLRADPRASSKARDKARSPPEPMYSDSRGWKLGPDDDPLVPGEHLSNLWLHKPTTMEVTEIGDVLLSPGFTPDREQDPLWAHRVMGAFGGRANGGFFCALENWLQRQINGEELQVKLTVKNGRWRVGRGAMCTLGKSPAPEGSLRRFLPWDERGQAMRAASLYLLQDDSAIIAYEQHLFWYSKTA